MARLLVPPFAGGARPGFVTPINRRNVFGSRTLWYAHAVGDSTTPVRLDVSTLPTTVSNVAGTLDVGGWTTQVATTTPSGNYCEWPSAGINLSGPFTIALRLRRNAAGDSSYDRVFHSNGSGAGASRFGVELIGLGDPTVVDGLYCFLVDSAGTGFNVGYGGTGMSPVSTTAYETHIITLDGVHGTLYQNGKQVGQTAISTFPAATLPNPIRYGTDLQSPGTNAAPVSIQFTHIMRGALTAAEAVEYTRDPWQVLQAPQRRIFLSTAAGITGTAADTQAPNTSAATGAIAITGTGADTQAKNTTAGAGKNLVSGTAADTQGKNTTSAAGANAVSGSAADTQAANSTSGTGANLVSGSAADTQQPNTITGTGSASVSGTAATTQALNAAVGTGQVAISGTAADTQQPNVSNGSANLADGSITGTAAISQAPNVSSGSGAVSVDGSAGITQQPNVSDGEATTDAANNGAGEYETKRKRRYVTKINGQLVVIPDPSVLDLLEEEPEPIKVPVKEIKAKAKVYNLDKEMAALLKAENYEQALKLHEDLQDEEDIEMLLLAL